MILKELIFNNFYLGRRGGLERTGFNRFFILKGCGGLGKTDFLEFQLWEGMVILSSFKFDGCDDLERTDF